MQSRVLPILSKRLKETRDKDSSLAAALKTAVFDQMLSKICYFMPLNYANPRASDSLKETRDKDSSLAAALKRWFELAGVSESLKDDPR